MSGRSRGGVPSAIGSACFFLSLPNAETAIARVALRVRQGGHDVPESVIRRRFAKGIENFNYHYRMLVDEWALYDNSGEHPVLMQWDQKP